MKKRIIFAILITLIGSMALNCTGCQSFKQYLGDNKQTLKEVVKSLVGEIIEEIFKQILTDKPVNLQINPDKMTATVTRYLVNNGYDEPESIIKYKEKLKKQIIDAIDNKEINIDDFFPG